jgi:integral membrane protein
MLRKAALVEGSTLILLVLIAVPLKRLMGMPEVVSIVGPIHGLAFLVYLGMLILFLSRGILTAKQWGIGFIAALIPFGSFVFERRQLSQI